MKGKILLGLFALPFFGVGVWMLWSISSNCLEAWQMRDWQPVPAQLLNAGYESHSGDDSTTYEAYASYTYVYGGRDYSGERVSLSRGADNIGDYQADTGRRLRTALTQNRPITVFVNPDAPHESIIDPQLRWGLLGFKSIFLLVFGGFGLGMLIVAMRRARSNPDAPVFQSAPWLQNPAWQGTPIRSNSKLTMWGAWGFALFWNLVSAPLPFVLYGEVVEKQNYVALAGLLFPIVGIGLLVWALRRTYEWRRFGVTPLALDPFPGSIGGHVGGRIDTRLPYDSSQRFILTLSSLRSYVTGTGKNRRRTERVLWQDQIVAHTEMGPTGTRVMFRFDVPDGLKESEAQPVNEDYTLWRLNLQAELPGTDINRDFEIPVYATASSSADISNAHSGAAETVQDKVYDEAVRKLARISNDGLGKTLAFPMGQHFFSNCVAILVGGIFAAAGTFIFLHEEQRLFGSIFGGVGGLILIAGLYMMFKSLTVVQRGDEIISTRRWLGIPLKRKTLRRSQFVRFEKSSNMQTSSGTQHVRYYTISGVDRQGEPVALGEGYKGELEAKAGIRFLSRELGLHEPRSTTDARADDAPSRFELNKELFVRRSASAK